MSRQQARRAQTNPSHRVAPSVSSKSWDSIPFQPFSYSSNITHSSQAQMIVRLSSAHSPEAKLELSASFERQQVELDRAQAAQQEVHDWRHIGSQLRQISENMHKVLASGPPKWQNTARNDRPARPKSEDLKWDCPINLAESGKLLIIVGLTVSLRLVR